MKKVTKLLMLLFAVVMSVSLFAGCGNDNNSKKSSEILVYGSSNWIKDIDATLAKKFYDETGTKVRFLPVADGDYAKNLDAALADGSDLVDIFMYGAGNDMRSKRIDKLAVDLSKEDWVKDYTVWAKDANTMDDKVYGFNTWGVDWEGVIYNKTYFAEKKIAVPTTWAQFIAACDKIAADGIVPFYENYNDNWHGYGWEYTWTAPVLAAHPDFYTALNSNSKKFADFPKFVEGMGQVKDFFAAKNTAGTAAKYYQNDGSATDWASSYKYMNSTEPKSVMLLTYSAQIAEKDWKDAQKAAGTNYEFGMFPLPVLDNRVAVSNGGGNARYINKNSKNVDACKEFFKFLAKDENLEAYYAERKDLVSASFKNVESVSATACTTDIQNNSVNAAGEKVAAPEMMAKNVTYFWDYNPTVSLQKFQSGGLTVAEFITELDGVRGAIFDKLKK